MANFDLVNLALKVTCPGNEIILDDKGLPSIMVRIPKFKISDVIEGGSDSTHPAFLVNGVEVPEIYISKFQNVEHNGRAYSLPGEDPRASITFDAARQCCEAKGAGWHLMTNAEWAAIALWCRKNNLMPKGNNNYGKDHGESTVVAIPTYYESDKIARVATGTGPVAWSHNGEVTGIWDMNGNVYEWMGGYRTMAGEIQILPNNDAADSGNSQAADSVKWKSILEDGTLADQGAAGALKWDYPEATNIVTLTKNITVQEDASRSTSFASLGKAADIATVPEILKALGLYPADAEDHGGDYFYMNNGAGLERLLRRGGCWHAGAIAGVFFAGGGGSRTHSGMGNGFRSAFIPGI
jgi:sulfatase modifying factor 1